MRRNYLKILAVIVTLIITASTCIGGSINTEKKNNDIETGKSPELDIPIIGPSSSFFDPTTNDYCYVSYGKPGTDKKTWEPMALISLDDSYCLEQEYLSILNNPEKTGIEKYSEILKVFEEYGLFGEGHSSLNTNSYSNEEKKNEKMGMSLRNRRICMSGPLTGFVTISAQSIYYLTANWKNDSYDPEGSDISDSPFAMLFQKFRNMLGLPNVSAVNRLDYRMSSSMNMIGGGPPTISLNVPLLPLELYIDLFVDGMDLDYNLINYLEDCVVIGPYLVVHLGVTFAEGIAIWYPGQNIDFTIMEIVYMGTLGMCGTAYNAMDFS